MREVEPHEVYNLGAQSHVRVSFDMPIYTADTVGMGAFRLLEAVRDHQQQSGRQVRYYQASSAAEGLGLGLHIARLFVRQLGGRIDIESPGKGQGCTVLVHLPATER